MKQVAVNDDDYNEAKALYESKCSLPEGDPERWTNFADFLRYYNLLDVRPLVQALSICFQKFREFFGVDPGTNIVNIENIYIKYKNFILTLNDFV